jgi:hypothetical protein
MPRYIVKDVGVYEPRRYRVIDTRQANAEVLRTKDRRIADGLAADYNSRFAPTLPVRIARWFGFCKPAPAVSPAEEPWQTKLRKFNEWIENRKNRAA